jgi:[acyl-carrier-protein] S-malonyltransferase
LSDNHLAFIFPAFTSDYSDPPGRNLPGFESLFMKLLTRAADCIEPELAGFSFTENALPENELYAQYLTYIYSCTASEIIRETGWSPLISAGYSMGIYAALFHTGSVSFESGLLLIHSAYRSLKEALPDQNYGMGTLIGLNGSDIRQIIDQFSLKVEITNQNASHSFVVSGNGKDIEKLMELAKNEGALHVRELPVGIPYHSGLLKHGADDFARQVISLKIDAPKTPVISMIDQIPLTTSDLVRNELVRNLFTPLNWFEMMKYLLSKNITHFIECGPSRGLARNAKFINGNYHFYTLNSIPAI